MGAPTRSRGTRGGVAAARGGGERPPLRRTEEEGETRRVELGVGWEGRTEGFWLGSGPGGKPPTSPFIVRRRVRPGPTKWGPAGGDISYLLRKPQMHPGALRISTQTFSGFIIFIRFFLNHRK